MRRNIDARFEHDMTSTLTLNELGSNTYYCAGKKNRKIYEQLMLIFT